MSHRCLAAALGVSLGVGPAVAQELHLPRASLAPWVEHTWLRLLDRHGAAGGRLSELGILQRFHRTTDNEYQLDLVTGRFRLSEDYEWARRENGARYWGASINKRDVVAAGEFKAAVPLGAGWGIGLRFDKEDSPEARRALARVAVTRRWSGGGFAAIESTLDPDKSGTDFELMGGWRGEGAAAPRVSLAVTLLDVLNDAIYQGLGVCPCYADSALDHERQPVALRIAADAPLGSWVRLEVHGGVVRPGRVRAYVQLAPDSGFRQDEAFGYASGLAEVTLHRRVRGGVFGTYVRAAIDREPIVAATDGDRFALTEREGRLAGYAFARLRPGWGLEAWLGRHWRAERRDSETPALPNVDYADRAWVGQFLVARDPPTGFQATLAVELDHRGVLRGDGELPGVQFTMAGDNTRLSLGLGWRFRQAALQAGAAFDLDGDTVGRANRRFDGARGRVVVVW